MMNPTRSFRLHIVVLAAVVACALLGALAPSAYGATIAKPLDFTNAATPATGDGYTWTNGSKTLALNGFTQSLVATQALDAITLPSGSTVTLTGTNALSIECSTSAVCSAIRVVGDLTVTGAGSSLGALSITGTVPSGITNAKLNGINSGGAVTIDNATITIDAALTTAPHAMGNGIICDGPFVARNASVMALGSMNDNSSWGIEATRFTMSDSIFDVQGDYGIGPSGSGPISISESDLVVRGVGGGIAANGGGLTVNATTLTVNASTTSATGFGVSVDGNAIFTDSDIAVDMAKGLGAVGLYVDNGYASFVRTNAVLTGEMAGFAVIQNGEKPSEPAPLSISDGYSILEGGTIAYYLAQDSSGISSIWTVSPTGSFAVDPATRQATGAATTVVIGPDPVDAVDTIDSTNDTSTTSADVKTGAAPLWPAAMVFGSALGLLCVAGVRRFRRV